jgi:putative SOS response-associated peptidase YedK
VLNIGVCTLTIGLPWLPPRSPMAHAAATAHGRPAGHQHPQQLFTALARWLKPENRCLVPFNSFAEYAPEPNPDTKKKDVVWFALGDDRPLTAFAGIWTEFKGDRGY